MYNNHELQDQDLQLTSANQVVELDDNELDNIAGGGLGALGGAILNGGNAFLDGKRGWKLVGAAGLGAVGGALGGGAVGGWVGAALSTPKA
ncbi:hypothetical protein [Scytonema sp. NUACC26]|uniref:hypothetical protein n=1 Tax=Scytonema sp. NUACC26 TaxID=3140176 RepID=UPI0034DBF629